MPIDLAAAPEHALRADAQRNRAAILAAATTVLAEQGIDADVREIARRSGVGMGTLYRHFGTKDDLVTTVLETQFTQWLTAAHDESSRTDDAWQALGGFFERMLSVQARNRAFVESYVTGGPSEACIDRCYGFLDDLRARCLDAGVLRPDVTVDDLILLSASLSQAVLATPDDRAAQWRRLLQISLDGLRSRNLEPLGPAIHPALDTPSASIAGVQA